MKSWNPERETYKDDNTKFWEDYNKLLGNERPCWNEDGLEDMWNGDYDTRSKTEANMFQEVNSQRAVKTKGKPKKKFSYVYTTTGREKRYN